MENTPATTTPFNVPDDVLPPASAAIAADLEKLVREQETCRLSMEEFEEKKAQLLGFRDGVQ